MKMSKLLIVLMIGFLCMTSCEPVNDVVDDGSTSQPKLHYVYGGVNGNRATEDPAVRISNLRINGHSGMSYSWNNGSSLAAWGLDDDSHGALACIFYLGSDGEWYGGKFDWISTSRRTRDFANLNSGYEGWEPDKFYASKHHGFLILSSDEKKRSNFVVQ